MSVTVTLAVVGVVAVASTVQGIVGFGFALLVAPATAALVDPRGAVVVVTVLGSIIPAGMAWTNRARIVREPATRISVGVILGTPLGLVLLLRLPTRGLKLSIAIAVLASVVVIWRGAGLSIGRRAEVGIGVISGALATSTGTNGPPVVLALQARRLDPDAFRATSAVCIVIADAITVALLAVTGQLHLRLLALCAFGVPAVLVGWWVGFRVRQHIPPEHFRSAVLGLLAVSAVVAIALAW